VYNFGQAQSNSSNVDFVYADGGLHSPFVAFNFDYIDNWGSYNATQLKRLTNVSVSEFESMTNALLIEKVTTSSVTGGSVDNVTSGNIIGFITINGQKGLIKVNSVSYMQIDITVKVQKP
jgi:hypothetical protein